MTAEKLNVGDEIRVIAPSGSLLPEKEEICQKAVEFLTGLGFQVSLSKNCRVFNARTGTGDIRSRVEDLHDAFADKKVKAVLAWAGGFHVNEILEYLDYDLIRKNPKIICGFSDITALLNAVYAKTGLVTYHGPHLQTFSREGFMPPYTWDSFQKCMMGDSPYPIMPSKEAGQYAVIQEGACEGTIVGGNLCTLNLLQGTEFMPDLAEKILFLEDDNIMGEFFVHEFERNLQSLLQVKGAKRLKGLVLGRFEESCRMTEETVQRIVSTKECLRGIPVLFNVDFGHVLPDPIATFPIGGKVRIIAEDSRTLVEILEH